MLLGHHPEVAVKLLRLLPGSYSSFLLQINDNTTSSFFGNYTFGFQEVNLMILSV